MSAGRLSVCLYVLRCIFMRTDVLFACILTAYQERSSGPMTLQLQMVVSRHTVLGIELRTSVGEDSVLTTELTP